MASPVDTLTALRSAWDGVVRPSVRRALSALVFGAIFCGAHLARVGTPAARIGAVALFGASIAAVVVAVVRARRGRRDVRRLVRRTVAPVDPPLAAATLRAVTLVERTAVDPTAGSPELAGLHLGRLLARFSPAALVARASRVSTRWSLAAVALALAGLAAVAIEPFRIVEGADVLVARHGEAPLPLAWIDEVEMSSTPPEYLHTTGGAFLPFSPTSVPRGTVVTVSGRPVRRGRALVLTDGLVDVPFVDDGAGAAVARWTVGDTTSLRVAARFGAVRVPQADEQHVTSIPDLVPKIVVEGAPRTVKLIDEPNVSIRYEATDDHGLREVDLVLRAAGKEERRVLSRPAADAKTDRGGYELRSNDAFLKKVYAPVEVTVEARDNDAVSGPKWGKSEAIVLVPPEVGEPEARRYAALLEARGALTDLLAERLGMKPPAPAQAKEHEKREDELQDRAVRAVEKVLAGSWGGLALRGRFVLVARGQIRRLKRALDAEKKAPSPAAHQKLEGETESALLALDAGLRALGAHDTQAVAKRLADVAEDAATAAATSEEGDRGPTKARIDADVTVLDGGGRQMLRLGTLGQDIGEIVATDLRRIGRARTANDVFHTELAARDLAARLRHPDPSFMGGGGHGGVEAGNGSGPSDGGDPSDAVSEAAAAMQDLGDLAREHQDEIDSVAGTLEGAGTPEEREAFKEAAKEHADAVRDAIKDLPPRGPDAASAESAAAEGRDQAEAMAGALERGDASGAVEAGKRAVASLAEAKRLGDQAKGFFPEQRAGQKAAEARGALDRELAWAEDALEKLRKAASGRVKGDLDEHAKREKKLGERAESLAKKGDEGDGSMPEEMIDHLREAERRMKDAEQALRQGDGQGGLDREREAQRLLEMAQNDATQDKEPQQPSEHEGGKNPVGKADVPGKDKHKGPEDFRKRVVEGLSGASDPALRDAVKRYAEGLLK